jgi:hypothetical protein
MIITSYTHATGLVGQRQGCKSRTHLVHVDRLRAASMLQPPLAVLHCSTGVAYRRYTSHSRSTRVTHKVRCLATMSDHISQQLLRYPQSHGHHAHVFTATFLPQLLLCRAPTLMGDIPGPALEGSAHNIYLPHSQSEGHQWGRSSGWKRSWAPRGSLPRCSQHTKHDAKQDSKQIDRSSDTRDWRSNKTDGHGWVQ